MTTLRLPTGDPITYRVTLVDGPPPNGHTNIRRFYLVERDRGDDTIYSWTWVARAAVTVFKDGSCVADDPTYVDLITAADPDFAMYRTDHRLLELVEIKDYQVKVAMSALKGGG